jgi:hypothetical protein
MKIKRVLVIGGSVLLAVVASIGVFIYSNRMTVSAATKILSIGLGYNTLYDIPAGTAYGWINAIPAMTDDTNYQQWVNGKPYGIFSATSAFTADISNDPSTKAFGFVVVSTSYYAKGSAPSNPVVDEDCTFTITNAGSPCDLDMKIGDFTGGVGWNIVAGVPSADEARITAYYSGQNPASGLVLANGDAEFYDSLAVAGHIHWDFKLETASLFNDGVAKSATLTITARAHS